MDSSSRTLSVKLPLPIGVYQQLVQLSEQEQQSLPDLLNCLIIEALEARAPFQQLLQAASTSYREQLAHNGKLYQSSEQVLQELRTVREQVAHEHYPG